MTATSPSDRLPEMGTFVCYLWRPAEDRPAVYGAQHVNGLWRQLRRFAPADWQRLVCVTDDPAGIDPDIETIDIDPVLLAAGRRYPKLSFYSGNAAEIFGDARLCMLDLDCVVTGPMDRLLARPEPIVAWADPNWGKTPYNSSIVLIDAGAFPQVRERFDPQRSDAEVKASRFMGSDQAWLAIVLGRDKPLFTRRDGVLSYISDCRRPTAHLGSTIVFFAGRPKPWDPEVLTQRDWVREAWT